LNIIYDDDT